MTVFNFDLEDGKPVIQLNMNPVNAGRFVTFMAECDRDRKRVPVLEKSLRDCLEQLEGWVSWKCPKKYVEAHREFIAQQRAVLDGSAPDPGEKIMPVASGAWVRYRFYANPDDYRPIKWPPAGPYWCTGIVGDCDHSVVVAFLPRGENLTDWWPEATGVESEEVTEIRFTERFARPNWWPLAGGTT